MGAADCEALSPGLLAQPVTAVSSLAFVAAAGWLFVNRPRSGVERRAAGGYAALVGLVGVGSLAYHGPQVTGSQLLHDMSITAVLAAGAGVPIDRVLRARPVLAESGRQYAPLAAAMLAAGVAAYLLGRTGSPLCSPDSLLQLHGLWHVLMAVSLAAWGAALWGRSTSPA